MQPFVLISILVFALIVIGALILAAYTLRKSSIGSEIADQEKHPQGYWISMGISIGAGFGVALGLVFENLALGLAIGAAIGVAIGSVFEQQNKDKLRPLNEPEKRLQRWGVVAGLLMLLVFAGLFILVLYVRGG